MYRGSARVGWSEAKQRQALLEKRTDEEAQNTWITTMLKTITAGLLALLAWTTTPASAASLKYKACDDGKAGHFKPPFRSFDHLVGAGKHRCRHFEAERLRGLQVDDEIELGRLHPRQVGGLLALKDSADIEPGLAIHIELIGAIADQLTGADSLAPRRHRG